MIFGINTWFLKEYRVSEALEIINSLGFKYSEIWMEHILKYNESLEEIKSKAKKLKMKLSLHATSYDINITSINNGIRKESLNQAKEAIETAKKLGCEVVVIHPGKLSTKRMSKDEYFKLLEDALKNIDQWAIEYDINIGLEAMEKKQLEVYVTADDINYILSKKWKKIGLTLDIAHIYTFTDIESFINKLKYKDLIYHVHLSDGDEKNVHLPLGWGKHPIINAIKFIAKYYSGLVAIEGYVPGQGKEVIKNNFNFLSTNHLL